MKTASVQLSISIDPKAPAASSDLVTFETGATREQVRDDAYFAYNHHGEGFNAASPGALSVFYEDLILGRPLPERLVTHRIEGMDTIVAMALFLHRDLAILERTPGFVATIDLLHRRGFTVIGHTGLEVEHLVYQLTEAPEPMNEDWLMGAIHSVCTFLRSGTLEGHLFPASYRVIDTGTNGFVFATSKEAALLRVWTDLYRNGWLRGLVLGPESQDGRRAVLASRKSPFVAFDLMKAAAILNEMEAAMGFPPDWSADEDWLRSPLGGTLILPEHLLQVFLRV